MNAPLLFIANIRLPTEKAHGVQIMKMCEAFAGAGQSVTLVVPTRKNVIQEDPFSYYSVKNNFRIKRVFSLDLIHWGKLGFFLQSASFALSVTFFALTKQDYVIYSRDESALFAFSFLSGFFRNGFFWESHTPKDNFLVRRVTEKARGIVAISGGLRKLYESHGVLPSKINVAHDAVDIAQFNLKEDREICRKKTGLPFRRDIVAYIGKLQTMGKDKGIEQLMQSFAEVKTELPGAFLVLVGANPLEVPAVEANLLLRGINQEDFKIIPHVHQREIPFYLRAVDVLIMNYPAAEHFALYMSPLKLFEYMASSTPIISSDLPVIREVVDEKSVFFVQPGDKKSLISAILQVLRNKALAQAVAQNALNIAFRYTWNERAKQILHFIS